MAYRRTFQMKRIFTKSLSALCIALFSTVAFPVGTDFDTVCQYFDKLQIEVSSRHLSAVERGNFISGLVNKELSSDSNASVAWAAIINASADQRYDLFKSAVKSVTHERWHCKAMERLISTVDAEKM